MNQLTKKQILVRQTLKNVSGFNQAAEDFTRLEISGTDLSEQYSQMSSTLKNIHPENIVTEVDRIYQNTPSSKTIRLTAAGSDLPLFQAGQYINVFMHDFGLGTSRPYTLSSSPSSSNFYEITIKRAPGGLVSNFILDNIKKGSILTISDPMGSFHYNPLFHGTDLIFLAGGSGITPARSMIPELLSSALNFNVTLIHSNSYEDDVIFDKYFYQLKKNFSNFKLHHLITRPSKAYSGQVGRISTAYLENIVKFKKTSFFYICGPSHFNKTCLQALLELDINRRNILIDINGPPKNPELEPGWPKNHQVRQLITVKLSNGSSFPILSGEPLLNSLEKNGILIKNRCRSGHCSLCRIHLLEGSVFQPASSLLRKSDRQFGWIHSCVAFPTSDIEIDL